jgi:hypothetical protein
MAADRIRFELQIRSTQKLSGRFFLSGVTPVDANGNVYALATLTFYVVGTTTPKDVYTTAALTVAHSNPLTLGSDGRIPEIFFDQTRMKVVFKDSSSNTISGLSFDGIDKTKQRIAASSAPSPTYPGLEWVDTSTTPDTLYERNSTNDGWLNKGSIDSVLAGRQTINVEARNMISRATNGAAEGAFETSTNKRMVLSLDFDQTTVEYAQFNWAMPESWNEGTMSAKFWFSLPSTTTNFNVRWGIQATAFSSGDTRDAAWGSAVEVTGTGGTTDNPYHTAETSAFTVGGTPSAGDTLSFQVYRQTAGVSGNAAVDARLERVEVYYTNDAVTDD